MASRNWLLSTPTPRWFISHRTLVLRCLTFVVPQAGLWQKQCAAPEYILALQTTLVVTRRECQEKVKHVSQEKEEALVKCSREWKRAIRTAAKRMNKEQQGQHSMSLSGAEAIVAPMSPPAV